MARATPLGAGKDSRKRRFPSKVQVATATDLVERSFARSEPDQLWVTDITEHRTRDEAAEFQSRGVIGCNAAVL